MGAEKITLRRRLSDWLRRGDGKPKLKFAAVLDPSSEDIDAVARGLRAYNNQFAGPLNERKLGCFVRDETDRIVGGAHGHVIWSWLYIERLWVESDLRSRGVGAEVLARLERLALSEGVFRFHVQTTSFQALDFYRKQGYEVYAELEDNPPGFTDYSLKKRIELNP
ncbi:MAG: GNAT family N-acetyltransferase [Pseudomonadota bacterium]